MGRARRAGVGRPAHGAPGATTDVASTAAVHPLLALQRAAGNAATASFVVQRQAASKADAQANVPAHVEPKPCFVWFTGNAKGWTPIPGTGCAHWIAHQLDLGRGSVSCDAGHMTRVRDVVKGRREVALGNARPGDIWQSTEVASHAGLVREAAADGAVVVEHDSVRRGGVVTETMTSGRFFRG